MITSKFDRLDADIAIHTTSDMIEGSPATRLANTPGLGFTGIIHINVASFVLKYCHFKQSVVRAWSILVHKLVMTFFRENAFRSVRMEHTQEHLLNIFVRTYNENLLTI